MSHRSRVVPFLLVAYFLLFGGNAFGSSKDWRVVSSSRFRLHHESPLAPAGVLNTLESLRAKLLLNLVAFAPWARESVIDVYLYRDAVGYHAGTQTPDWAAGHVAVTERAVHTFEGEHFQTTMAHELAHLFFEDFFAVKGVQPPTWLNEGVATWMELEYGSDRPRAARELFAGGETASLDAFLRFSYYDSERSRDEVSSWYVQASSVVEFLNREFPAFEFFRLCEKIRDGKSLQDALPLAYGPRLPDVSTLERFWRRSLGPT